MAKGTATKGRARHILDRFKEMKAEKQNWLPHYELIGKYVFPRKQHFNTNVTQGEAQNNLIFDDTAPNALHLMVASLLGAMWPNGAKSFRITMPFGMEEELDGASDQVKSYYEWVTKTMASYMDNPKSNFITALEEYLLDQGAFGTSGIMAEDQDDLEVPIFYRAVDAKALYIAESQNGFVDTVYAEKSYTVRQLVVKYGYEKVSEQWRKLYDSGDCKTKVSVLHAIEPRVDRDPFGFGKKNMPFASIHIDIATEKILKEDGMLELPVAVGRFWKAMGEIYGRSPAMNALPSVLEANALGEAWVIAVEKTLDPPLVVLDDGSLGGGTIDTSASALNVISVSGRINSPQDPIRPLFTVGDLQWTAARRTELAEIIKNHFYQDRLMDLNNEQRMTLGEANIRNELRGLTLNPIYSRNIGEVLVPTIEQTFNKLRRRGFLGVIPGSPEERRILAQGGTPRYIPQAVINRMLEGKEIFRITFTSPATRIMQSDELQGITQTLSTILNIVPANPEAMDTLDLDWTLKRLQELTGAPSEMMNSMQTVTDIRDARKQQQEAMMLSETMRQDSETARNLGQAAVSTGLTQQEGEQVG